MSLGRRRRELAAPRAESSDQGEHTVCLPRPFPPSGLRGVQPWSLGTAALSRARASRLPRGKFSLGRPPLSYGRTPRSYGAIGHRRDPAPARQLRRLPTEVARDEEVGVLTQMLGGSRRRRPLHGRARRRGRRSRGRGGRAARRARPRRARRRRTSRTTGSRRSTITGARPRLSSSSSSSLGFWISAHAIASICCSPPESRPARRSCSSRSAGKYVRTSSTWSSGRALADAKVLADGEAVEDAAPLGNVRDARRARGPWARRPRGRSRRA